MNQGTIIVRMSRSSGFYNKSNKYTIKISNAVECELNYENNRKEFLLAPGIHSVFVNDATSNETQEVKLIKGKVMVITVKPVLSYKLVLGVFLAIVFSSLIIQIIVNRGFSLMSLVPLLFLIAIKKSNFKGSFLLTQTSPKY
ncbi:hypothetical protein [Flavobacterium sandaracinum]|uniref:Uncharacterized protein n=1 Tax=Flavobacterium sandaracinum TaxID=2541733 RepID=A0A4R5D2F1_9FLAO|nr:hypothetical protein [Flavobacterium sandaracinum]TDE06000.1 hypothetical protein E0F91_05325 [Flavobacterium sandaracinum]